MVAVTFEFSTDVTTLHIKISNGSIWAISAKEELPEKNVKIFWSSEGLQSPNFNFQKTWLPNPPCYNIFNKNANGKFEVKLIVEQVGVDAIDFHVPIKDGQRIVAT